MDLFVRGAVMIRWLLEKTGVLAVIVEEVRQDDKRKEEFKAWTDSLSSEDMRLLLLQRQDSHYRKRP